MPPDPAPNEDAVLQAHREAARTTLARIEEAMGTLILRPPAPLRRPPAEALEAIRAEADAVLNGTDPRDRRPFATRQRPRRFFIGIESVRCAPLQRRILARHLP